MATFIKMLGVEIPVDVDNFITPDWKDVLDFHATWVKKVEWRSMDPWPFQPYMLEYAKELEKLGASENLGSIRIRTADQWLTRCMEHYGLGFIEHYAKLNTVPRG